MAIKRQDAWTQDDDMVLAEVTLRHIREGGTQLSAFEEVAHKLERTPAACGFRWNSAVRKQYEKAIQVAKQQRKKRDTAHSAEISTYQGVEFGDYKEGDITYASTYSLDNIIRYLRQYKNELNELKRIQKQLEKELAERQSELQYLEQENKEMKMQLSHMQSDYHLVNDDYRTLLQIMERARKMAYYNGSQEKDLHNRNNPKYEEINK